jgi:putative MATE family efflux protein
MSRPPSQQIGRLTTGSITGHLIGQTTPVIIAIAAMTSVGLVDAYFIGQLGSSELAAMSFVFPIANALASLGVGVMASISSVVSRRLGAGDLLEAQRIGNLGLALAAGLGLVMGLALFLLRHELFRLMQAEESLLPIIDEFMTPYALFFPLMMVLMGINGNLRAQGEAKRSSMIMITVALVNVVLNPLLIDGLGIFPGFGVAGSAYATVISWLVACWLGISAMRKTDIHCTPSILKGMDWRLGTKSLARVAAPASFANAINPMGISVLTALLAAEGSAAVAGFGAAARLQAFALVPLLALSASIGAIVGQNWGREAYDRARSALFQANVACVIYGLVVALLLFLGRHWLAGIFTDDPQVMQSFARYIEIAAWGYAGFGMLITTNGAFNAIDRASTALVMSFARVFLLMLPVAALLQPLWGEDAVYAGELLANLGGGIVAALLAIMLFARIRAAGGQRTA